MSRETLSAGLAGLSISISLGVSKIGRLDKIYHLKRGDFSFL
jgi:hypothetical protein